MCRRPGAPGSCDGLRRPLPASVHPIGRSFRKGKNNSLETDRGTRAAPGRSAGRGWSYVAPPGPRRLRRLRFLVETDGPRASRWPSTMRCNARRTTPGSKSTPSGSTTGPMAPSPTPRTLRKSTRTSPLNFWPAVEADRVALWEACKGIVDFWADRGIRIFRVDNPHTKPFAFWEWLIKALRGSGPIWSCWQRLSRGPSSWRGWPRSGSRRAIPTSPGGSASTGQKACVPMWRSSPTDHLPTTCAPISGQHAGHPVGTAPGWPAGGIRLALHPGVHAGALYGVYGGYELSENAPLPRTMRSTWGQRSTRSKSATSPGPGSLAPVHDDELRASQSPCVPRMRNVYFHGSDNPNVIAYSKASDDGGDVVLVIVTLDPYATQEATLDLDAVAFGLFRAGRSRFTTSFRRKRSRGADPTSSSNLGGEWLAYSTYEGGPEVAIDGTHPPQRPVSGTASKDVRWYQRQFFTKCWLEAFSTATTTAVGTYRGS